jgi:cysteine desulfurase
MVYLDYNASTPLDQRVLPVFNEALRVFGNAASTHHSAGQAAAELIEEARSRVACLAGRPVQDVIFTSGASEAAVIGIVGAALGAANRPNLVVAATEHKAILAAAELGARLTGGQVRRVPVDAAGNIDLTAFQDAMDDSVSVSAVMAVNNETGVVGWSPEIVAVARRHGVLNFVDATQLLGKRSLGSAAEDADLAVCSSHKIYGPKGAGALILSRRVQREIVPILSGGGQERGIRGGTHNTPALVGFGLAAQLAEKEHVTDAVRMGSLAVKLLDALKHELNGVTVNGEGAERVSNTLNLRFAGADAEAVMASMPQISVSSGSACQSASPSPSHVLLAMGLSGTEASESLRISLGRPTTTDEVQIAANAIINAVNRVRDLTTE